MTELQGEQIIELLQDIIELLSPIQSIGDTLSLQIIFIQAIMILGFSGFIYLTIKLVYKFLKIFF